MSSPVGGDPFISAGPGEQVQYAKANSVIPSVLLRQPRWTPRRGANLFSPLTSEWPRACGIEFYLVKRFERARFSLQWKNPRLAGFTHAIFTRLAHFFSTCVRRFTSGTWDAETDFCPENRTSGLVRDRLSTYRNS